MISLEELDVGMYLSVRPYRQGFPKSYSIHVINRDMSIDTFRDLIVKDHECLLILRYGRVYETITLNLSNYHDLEERKSNGLIDSIFRYCRKASHIKNINHSRIAEALTKNSALVLSSKKRRTPSIQDSEDYTVLRPTLGKII